MYHGGTGVQMDGTISLDPTALSYLLGAGGLAVLPDRVLRVAAGRCRDTLGARAEGLTMRGVPVPRGTGTPPADAPLPSGWPVSSWRTG
jgi:hypothetical protein